MEIAKHECGGTILVGTVNTDTYHYCGKCEAFQFVGMSVSFPNGTDKLANRKAWDMMEQKSPHAPPA